MPMTRRRKLNAASKAITNEAIDRNLRTRHMGRSRGTAATHIEIRPDRRSWAMTIRVDVSGGTVSMTVFDGDVDDMEMVNYVVGSVEINHDLDDANEIAARAAFNIIASV